jgi:hypothetical protein
LPAKTAATAAMTPTEKTRADAMGRFKGAATQSVPSCDVKPADCRVLGQFDGRILFGSKISSFLRRSSNRYFPLNLWEIS